MNRRTLLSGFGSVCTLALAGCLGGGSPPTADDAPAGSDGDGGDSGDDGGSGDDDSSDSDDTTGGVPDDDDRGGGADDGSAGTHPRFTEMTLTDTGTCPDAGIARVDFGSEVVTVTGCARGRNGCTAPVLADLTYDSAADLVTVVVASELQAPPDAACTEVLKHLGYEVRVALDGTLPGTVAVVHDDVDGRREVARVSRTQT